MSIERYRGDDKRIGFSLASKKTSTKPAAAIDLTDCTLTLSVSTVADPATADYIFQSTAVITDAAAGEGYFPLVKAQVDFVGDVFYDISLIDANGEEKTIVKSTWTSKQDIGK